MFREQRKLMEGWILRVFLPLDEDFYFLSNISSEMNWRNTRKLIYPHRKKYLRFNCLCNIYAYINNSMAN